MKINILEEISPELAKDVINQLAKLKPKEAIEVQIFSYGGDILAGNAIIQALKDTGAQIHTNVIGVAASMAAVISQVGHKRTIAPDAKFNIHNGEMPTDGRGTKEAHLDAAKMLEVMDKQLTAVLSKSKLSKAEIQQLMEEDILMSAEDAIELGFFDSLSSPIKAVAKLNKSIRNMNILNQLKGTLKATLGKLKAVLTDEEAARVAELQEMESLTEAEAEELAMLLIKAEEEEVVEEGGEASGAEILTAEMVTTKEFNDFAGKVTAALETISKAMDATPNDEEVEAMVDKKTTAKLDSVLKAIRSKTTIPNASQNFAQPAKQESNKLAFGFLAKKSKEINNKNKR